LVILGIDPGTATTGYGVLEGTLDRPRVLACDCIRTSARSSTAERLKTIFLHLNEILEEYRPDVVAVERLFFNKNAQSAFAVGQARGVAILAAATRGIEVREYTPLQVKIAVTGYGRASKPQVQSMVKMLLGLREIPRPDDAADALAVALTCMQADAVESRLAGRGRRMGT